MYYTFVCRQKYKNCYEPLASCNNKVKVNYIFPLIILFRKLLIPRKILSRAVRCLWDLIRPSISRELDIKFGKFTPRAIKWGKKGCRWNTVREWHIKTKFLWSYINYYSSGWLRETRTQFNGVVILIIKNINSVFYCRFVPCFSIVFLFSFAQTFSKKHNTKITIKFENVIRYLSAYILWDD